MNDENTRAAIDILSRSPRQQLGDAHYRELVECALQGIVVHREFKPLMVNNAWAQIFGFSCVEEVLALESILPNFAPEEQIRLQDYALKRLKSENVPDHYVYEGVSRDGRKLWIETYVRRVDWSGKPAIMSLVIDITEKRAAETALHDSEQRYRQIFDTADISLWDEDFTTVHETFVRLRNEGVNDLRSHLNNHPELIGELARSITVNHVNDATVRLFEASSAEQLLGSLDKILPESADELFLEELVAIWEGRERFHAEVNHNTFAGNDIWVIVTMPIPKSPEEFKNVPVSVIDVTEKKRTEERLARHQDDLAHIVEERTRDLRDSEEKYRDLVDGSVQGVIVHQNAKIVYANATAAKIHGFELPQMFGLSVHRLFPKFEQERISKYRDEGGENYIEFQAQRPNGDLVWIEGYARNINWEGKPARQNTFVNIDARKKAEQELAASEAQLRAILDNSPLSVDLNDMDGRLVLANETYERFFAAPRDQFVGKTLAENYPIEIATKLAALDRQVIQSGKAVTIDHEVVRSHLPIDFIRITKFPVLDQHGKITGVGCFTVDTSNEKAAELRLLQSQKMEAVGQLTGGIAHDFNNILTAIIGSVGLLGDDNLSVEHRQKSISLALGAATRGEDLTKRLLAFSRQQDLFAEVTNINDVIPNFCQLAERTIGVDVEIQTNLVKDLWLTKVDSGQLENALLNLAINSRHALPHGGRLMIETANRELDEIFTDKHEELTPGSYVTVSASDNGTGMSKEVLERVFEPFYTTKEVGTGSGLGLSMVFGFAKQSNGHVSIRSKVGSGTKVTIFLPKAENLSN